MLWILFVAMTVLKIQYSTAETGNHSTLSVSDSELGPAIPADYFLGYDHVTSLFISNSGLEEFPNLTYIARGLESLEVTGNSIVNITAELLLELEDLTLLNVSDNLLVSFPNVPIDALKNLCLSENLFKVFPNLSRMANQIEQLDLGMNSISLVTDQDVDGFDSIKVLKLNWNQLHSFPGIESIKDTLCHLSLKSNFISQISPMDILFLESNRSCNGDFTLDLEDNHLTSVPPIGLYGKDIIIFLSLNPIACDQRMTWFAWVSSVRDHDEATYDYAQNFGSCMYPMRFAAMPIYSLTSEDFDLSDYELDDPTHRDYAGERSSMNKYAVTMPLVKVQAISALECMVFCTRVPGCLYFNYKPSDVAGDDVTSGGGHCHYASPEGLLQSHMEDEGEGWMYYYVESLSEPSFDGNMETLTP